MSEIYIVAGGDERFSAAAAYLAEKGNTVYAAAGSGSCGKAVHADIADIPQADVLILPIPVSADGENLFAPAYDGKIPLEKLSALVRKNGSVFGGRPGENVSEIFRRRGLEIFDYTLTEEFAVRNAAATAEGAVSAASEMQDITLFGQKILIIGLGRIGRSLALILRGYGADISVASRRSEHLVWAEMLGCHGIPLDEAKRYSSGFSLIFNTAPAPVLGTEMLSVLDKEVLVIDLASAPGGTDFAEAKRLGLNVFHLTGLPGKTSPRSAGITAAKAVENELSRRRKEENG